jgi:DNA uptake protein ComE-like DNA-binding protein
MKEKKDTAIRSADIDLAYFDLNYASEQDIAEIPGVGSDIARGIIRGRPYTEIDELFDKVPGFTDDHYDELVRAGATVGQGVKDEREFQDAK